MANAFLQGTNPTNTPTEGTKAKANAYYDDDRGAEKKKVVSTPSARDDV